MCAFHVHFIRMLTIYGGRSDMRAVQLEFCNKTRRHEIAVLARRRAARTLLPFPPLAYSDYFSSSTTPPARGRRVRRPSTAISRRLTKLPSFTITAGITRSPSSGHEADGRDGGSRSREHNSSGRRKGISQLLRGASQRCSYMEKQSSTYDSKGLESSSFEELIKQLLQL